MPDEYLGIRFPNRAESLDQFAHYRVFLEHWEGLGAALKALYEGVSLRRETRILAIHGAQGTGKTLFSKKLAGDHERTEAAMRGGAAMPAFDAQNLWHLISSGRSESAELVARATRATSIVQIENTHTWPASVAKTIGERHDRLCIAIADNAERPYFRQGLLELTAADYLDRGESPAATRMAAQALVQKCRAELRGFVLVLLSNDALFLLELDAAIQDQHSGLMNLQSLPVPRPTDRETVVRVNVNRLNPITYWYCLDKAGPEYKRRVRTVLDEAGSFTDAFESVDAAIREAPATRLGRRARKNLITLIVLANTGDASTFNLAAFGEEERNEALHGWIQSRSFKSGWARGCIDDDRERQMLESEWNLRIVILGNPFCASLLSGDQAHLDACTRLLGELREVYGPGRRMETIAEYEGRLHSMVDSWPDTSTLDTAPFWAAGQQRSARYEAVLRTLLPGYNTGGGGFLQYRPDYVVEGFSPASVTRAISTDIDALAQSISRQAHVFEFTAAANIDALKTYLRTKLGNYVEVTQEQ